MKNTTIYVSMLVLASASLEISVNADVIYFDGGIYAEENTSQAGTGDLSYSAGNIFIDGDGSENGYKSGNTNVVQMSDLGAGKVGSNAETSFYGRFLWLPGPTSPTSFINFSSTVGAGRLTFVHSGSAQIRLFDRLNTRIGTLDPPPLTVGETNLIVFRIDMADLARTGEETVKFWYNPTSSAEVEAGDNATVSFTFDLFDETNDGFGAFQSILPQDPESSTPQLDNIVFAEKAADLWSEPAEPFTLAITPSGSNPGNYAFEWVSKPGMVYDLVSATDLTTSPSGWGVWNGSANIASGGATTSLSEVPSGGNQARFFAVVEKNPPPLLSEDFELDNGGFTFTVTDGTAWVHGAPTSNDSGGNPNPGGSVTEGNDGSLKCWGTDIANPGFYVDPTIDSCLRSPNINLTQVAAANLSFAQAIDVPGSDTMMVEIIDVSTGTSINFGVFPLNITDSEVTSAAWQNAGPYPLPVNVEIRVEWCLNGTAGGSKDYMGWYIDDVVINSSTP